MWTLNEIAKVVIRVHNFYCRWFIPCGSEWIVRLIHKRSRCVGSCICLTPYGGQMLPIFYYMYLLVLVTFIREDLFRREVPLKSDGLNDNKNNFIPVLTTKCCSSLLAQYILWNMNSCNFFCCSISKVSTISRILIQICMLRAFLHLHEIVEGLYFHCSLSVCVCVCVCLSVCVSGWILVNKIPAERMNRFGCGFR